MRREFTSVYHEGKCVRIYNFIFENGIISGRVHGHEITLTFNEYCTPSNAKHALVVECIKRYGSDNCDRKTINLLIAKTACENMPNKQNLTKIKYNGKAYCIYDFNYDDKEKTATGRLSGRTYKVTANDAYEARCNLIEAKLNNTIALPLYKSKKHDDGSVEVNGIVNGTDIQLFYTGIAVNEYNETSDGKPFCAKIREDLERKYNEIMNGGENMNNEIEMKVDDQFIKAFVEAGCTAVGKELKCKGYVLDLNDKTITEALEMINEAIDKYEERKAEINKMISATLARLSA